MQHKISLFVETDNTSKLKFQVYLTDENEIMIKPFNARISSAAGLLSLDMHWEYIAKDMLEHALVVYREDYLFHRLLKLGLTEEQLEHLGFENKEGEE